MVLRRPGGRSSAAGWGRRNACDSVCTHPPVVDPCHRFYFHDDAEDATAPYSYIRVDPRTQRVVDIREKVAISRLANGGAYVFPSAAVALTGLEALIGVQDRLPTRLRIFFTGSP